MRSFYVSLLLAGLFVSPIVSVPTSGSSNQVCRRPSVRKEWRSLGPVGQLQYVNAIKCLTSLPHDPSLSPTGATAGLQPINPNSSRYDDVVYTHMDAVDSAHFTGRFLAWHRLFLHTFENILRTQCNYPGRIPYWDWTQDAADIKHSPIFDPNLVHGLGAFPNANSNFTVVTGAFRNLIRAYPYPHRVQRNYTLHPFEAPIFPWTFDQPYKQANETQTKAEWNKIITSFVGNYTALQAYIDGFRAEGLHNAAHISLGGDMANVSHSPNDPLFWLLHGNLDRLWAFWQAHDPANQYVIGGGETQDFADIDTYITGIAPWVTKDTWLYMSNIGPDAQVSDVLNVKGGYLCYEYAN